MAIEPTEGNVLQVAEFAGCDKDTARRYLKAKNDNVEAAVMAILEGEDISKLEVPPPKIGEQVKELRRDSKKSHGMSRRSRRIETARMVLANPLVRANPDLGLNPSDLLDLADTPKAYNEANLRPLGTSAAPTRGPSPAPSYRQPTSKAQEDDEMERALALSREGLPYDTVQESGVVTSDGKSQITSHYDSTYDPKKWAMVRSGPSGRFDSNEVVPDPDPNDRKHQGDEPRFLKQLPCGDYLPNFLTIIHSVPLAREALLFSPFAPVTYSHDSDWWRGQDIKLPRIVNTHDGSTTEPLNGPEEEIVAEMQRLMAFLDSSQRSYASAESLVRFIQNKHVGFEGATACLIDHAMCAWESSANTLDPSGRKWDDIFRTIPGTTDPQGISTPNVWSLALDTSVEYQKNEDMVTLEEILDEALWETSPDSDVSTDNYLERCAEILTFRVDQHDKTKDKLGLTIPTSLYVDRYLKDNIEKTRPIRQQMAQAKQRMVKLNEISSSLMTLPHPRKSEQLDASLLMKYVCGMYSGANRKAVLEERESRGMDLSDAVPEPPPEHAATAQKLEAICESIADKLKVLEQEKIKAQEALSQLSKQDLAPTEHRFTLRGVATKPNVTYVLRRKAQEVEQLIDLGSSAEADAPPGMQWWRIQYDTNASDVQVHKSVSSQDEVLQAVEVEYNQALLVYASNKAVEFIPSSMTLPSALREFVDRDNAHFTQECRDHQGSWEPSYSWNEAQGWGNEAQGWNNINTSRRVSIDSTKVNIDETMGDDEPPPYYSFDDDAPLLKVSDEKEPLLEPNQMSQMDQGHESPPAHEIRIDEVEDDEPEMVETGHGFLSQSQNDRRKSDSTMLDVDREDEAVANVEETDASKTKCD